MATPYILVTCVELASGEYHSVGWLFRSGKLARKFIRKHKPDVWRLHDLDGWCDASSPDAWRKVGQSLPPFASTQYMY